jgi:hypothetical protein
MNVALMSIIVLGALFALAFLTKRRFGVLGLALAAGAMLSSLWAETLTPVIREAGVMVDAPPLATLVAVALVLLPSVVLLFSGPSYSSILMRVVGAFSYAALALALLIEPMGSALILEGRSVDVYQTLLDYRVYIVTAGLVFALFDILSTRTPKHRRSGKH